MKKRITALFLVVAMLLTAMAPMAFAEGGYSDVDGHWGQKSIDRWVEAGVAEGVSEGVFAPNSVMTRGQAAKVFANLLGLSRRADLSQYTDLDIADPAYDAFALCVAAGIFNGVDANTMAPNGEVTREQLFTIFARALGIQPKPVAETIFTDSDKVAGWAAGYVNALADMKAVGGMGDGTVRPKDAINRASVMAVLDKAIAVYANTDGATVGESEGIILVVGKNVTVKGGVETLVVAGGSVNIDGAKVDQVNVVGENAQVSVSNGSSVTNLRVEETAAGAAVTVNKGAHVSALESKADGVTIGGQGDVTSAVVSGNNTAVNTEGTSLTVAPGTSGVVENNKPVSGGATVETAPGTGKPGTNTPGTGGTTPPVNPPVYIPTYYTVSFVNADGTLIESQTVREYTSPVTPAVAVGEGQQLCWYNEQGAVVADPSADYVVSNRVFTAVVGSNAFTAGNGTARYPYQVANAEQFKAIGTLSSAMRTAPYSFELVNDIDLSAETTGGWITHFGGELDGNGHRIIGFATTPADDNYCLIADTVNDVTIHDLTLVQNGSQPTTLIFCVNRYSNRVGTVKLQNINVEQKLPGAVVNCGNNDGPYVVHAFLGSLALEKCINYADFNFATYGALFVGGYAHKGMTVDFINCVNNGKLTGANVALFVGNPSNGPATVTVTNCANNGTVHGVTTEGWFSRLSNSTVYEELNNSVVVAGNPVGDQSAVQVQLGLTKNSDNTLTITVDNPSAVAYYMVRARASSGFTKPSGPNGSGGSSYVVIQERIDAGLTTKTPFASYIRFVDESKVEGPVTFDENRRESYVNARYTVLENGVVVFNSQDMIMAQQTPGEIITSVNVNSVPTFVVEAYAANGTMIGEYTVSANGLV